MVLTVVVLLPVLVALVLAAAPRIPGRAASWAWVATSAVDLALVAWIWWRADLDAPGASGVVDGIAYDVKLQWIPTVDASYHVGVDGLSLPLLALTGVIFLACAVWSLREPDRPRTSAALFLFLQTACLGTFAALDLILFFVFFDLTIVGMYFIIAGWGHGNARRSALKFFLYTFLGSLALLLGFIGLFLGGEDRTFDMVRLAADPPLDGSPVAGGLVLLAIGLGLAIKTPVFPFHTWLPDAHTDAPAAGSAVLAGVLLKLGTYGLVRIAMPILPEAWQRWAGVIVAVGVVSVLWGAFVALAQTDLKRMIAYTSVNHMGYVVLGLGAAGLVSRADEQARTVATVGAVYQMVSHGLLTGALFLLTGVLWSRGGTYAFDRWGGLARSAPRFAALFAVAAFGALGLPGLSAFVAEFQVFTGALQASPVATIVAVTGVLVTAALFLVAIQRLLTGPTLVPEQPALAPATPVGATRRPLVGALAGGSTRPGPSAGGAGRDDGDGDGDGTGRQRPGSFRDIHGHEFVAIAPLLVLAVLLGLVPRPLLDVVEPAAAAVVALVGR